MLKIPYDRGSITRVVKIPIHAQLKNDYLNIGIGRQLHLDIDYFYGVFPKAIRVYEISEKPTFTAIEKSLIAEFPFEDVVT